MTYTATVTATSPASGTPTGTVNFRDAGVTIAGCAAQAVGVAATATCAVAYAGVGTHAITGTYSGDANFTISISPILTQTVNPGATTTALTSSSDPSVSGQGLTYTATITATAPASGTPTGTVNFWDAGVTIAGCGAQPLVAGIASCGVMYAGVGTHAIAAVYSGDADFTSSTSPVLTQTVNPGATTMALTQTSTSSIYLKPVTLTAAVTPVAPGTGVPTGTVAFTNGMLPIVGCEQQPMSAGVATCSTDQLTGGAHALNAAYSGSGAFAAAWTTIAHVVERAPVVITVSSDRAVVEAGGEVELTAHVTPTDPPTGLVTFLEESRVLGSATLDATATARLSVVLVTLGTHRITALYGGDDNFLPGIAQAALTLTVLAPVPIPDTGASAAAAATWGAISVLGGAVLLAWKRRAPRRRPSALVLFGQRAHLSAVPDLRTSGWGERTRTTLSNPFRLRINFSGRPHLQAANAPGNNISDKALHLRDHLLTDSARAL